MAGAIKMGHPGYCTHPCLCQSKVTAGFCNTPLALTFPSVEDFGYHIETKKSC